VVSELLGVCLRQILVWHHTLTHLKIYSQPKSYREKQNNHAAISHLLKYNMGCTAENWNYSAYITYCQYSVLLGADSEVGLMERGLGWYQNM